MTALKEFALGRFDKWVKRRNPAGVEQLIESNKIYILPSGFGLLYAFIVLTLFLSAINYQLSTIFLLTFLMIVIGLLSAWEAHANLKNLKFNFLTINDTQARKPAQIQLFIHTLNKTRFALEIRCLNQVSTRLELLPEEGLEAIVPISTDHRGHFSIPRLTILSRYPFGLFRVWSYVQFTGEYYVFPEPINPGFLPSPTAQQTQVSQYKTGDEEFYDLKQVDNPWAQANKIAWKIVAKQQGWFIKVQDSKEGEQWLFQLADLPQIDIETQLSYLSFWLSQAEEHHHSYALKLKDTPTEFEIGPDHLKHCLRQLAVFQ